MLYLSKSGLFKAQISNNYTTLKSLFEIQKFKTYANAEVQPMIPSNKLPQAVSGGMLKVEKDKEKKRNVKFQ